MKPATRLFLFFLFTILALFPSACGDDDDDDNDTGIIESDDDDTIDDDDLDDDDEPGDDDDDDDNDDNDENDDNDDDPDIDLDDFRFEIVADSYGRATKLAIDLDPNNAAHIAASSWPDQELIYASNLSGTWETIYTRPAHEWMGYEWPAIHLEEDQTVHIFFTTSEYGDDDDDDAMDEDPRPDSVEGLFHMTDAAGSWNLEKLEEALVLDPDSISPQSGEFHLSYYINNGNLYYLTNQSGSWVYKDFDVPAQHATTAIDMDSLGNIGIFYGQDGGFNQLHYVSNETGDWVNEGIPKINNTTWDDGFSLAFDSGDNPVISYQTADWYSDGRWVTVQSRTSGIWSGESLPGTSPSYGGTSLVVDQNNDPLLTYIMVNPDNPGSDATPLSLAFPAGDSWQVIGLAPSARANVAAPMLIDPDGFLHIVYHDYENSKIVYTTNRPA